MVKTKKNNLKLLNFQKTIRKKIIEKNYLTQAGHLGGCLSCVEIISNIFQIKKKRDIFVLSKGHCGLTLYVVLYLKKLMSKKVFDSFLLNNSSLGEHPSPYLNNYNINFSTGALGHGLSYAVGLAKANKLKKNKNKIYVLISDGELNCGSTWEALLLTSKFNLDNLIILIDFNGYQATGKSNEILPIEPIISKFKSFGIDIVRIDGHNNQEILKYLKQKLSRPLAILCKTLKGKGISFMENDNNWHYRSPNFDELHQAISEIEKK
jgi:transketolase